MTHEEFEKALLVKLLQGDHPDLRALREQQTRATVSKRDWTSSGVYVYFSVPADCPLAAKRSAALGDVRLILVRDIPADAILHIKDGKLEALECLRYDAGEWPRDPEIQELNFQGHDKRDPDYLKNELDGNRPEAEADIVLKEGVQIPPSPASSFGFICSFGAEAYSAAVIPAGSGHLKASVPCRIRLRFLVPGASVVLKPGATFTFFEQGRKGEGRIL